MAEPITIEFVGTVVSCETRFETTVKTAKLVDFDPRWVITIDVESTGDPISESRVSFLIHSPALLFRSPASTFTGWRCQFTVDREVTDGRTSWSNLTAKQLT